VTTFHVEQDATVLMLLGWDGRAVPTCPNLVHHNTRVNRCPVSVQRCATHALDPRATVLTMPGGETALVEAALVMAAALPALATCQ
jgi:hypothetical protein